MMKSSSSPSSKIGKRCSQPHAAGADSNLRRRRRPNPRNPLKDLNGIASSCSSSSSASVETPGGCLNFFRPNNFSSSSSSSSLARLHRSRPFSKTPKSAPNSRPSKPTKSAHSNSNENLLMPSSQKADKRTKNPPRLCHWQSRRKPTSRAAPKTVSNNNGSSTDRLESVSEEFAHNQLQEQHCFVRVADDAGKPSETRQCDSKAADIAKCTPVSKLTCRSSLDSTINVAAEENLALKDNTTPPVEASLSPELQCGSAVLSTTPVCYGTGHMLSGLIDKRKCRPRGILTVLDNELVLAKVNSIGNGDDEEEIGPKFANTSGVSKAPSPVEASMHWLLSPSIEEDENQMGNNGNRSHQNQRLVSLMATPYSSSSGHILSAEACKNSSNTRTTATTSTPAIHTREIRSYILSPSGNPEFLGFLGDPTDDMAGCSSLSSPHTTPNHKVISQEERKFRYNLGRVGSPISMDSLGSGNVMQTPQSDSSLDRHGSLLRINADDSLKNLLETELDSVAAVIQRTSLSPKSQISMWDSTGFSFEVTQTTSSHNSIDLTHFHKTLDCQASWMSNSALEDVPQSQVRISWRDGLMSRIFEMDELDCCRCLSDEEEDDNGCSEPFKSSPSPESNPEVGNDEFPINCFGSSNFVDHGPGIDRKGKEKFPFQKQNPCAESISTDVGDLAASGDSDWNLCYKNQLFKI